MNSTTELSRAHLVTLLVAMLGCGGSQPTHDGAGPGISGTGGAANVGTGGASGGVAQGGSGATGGASGAGATPGGGSAGDSNSGGSTAGQTMRPPPGPVPDVAWVQGTCSGGADTLNFETAEFCVRLEKSSQTVISLQPKAAPGFDFAPFDQVASRSGAGYFYLGDITLRVRSGTSGDWQNASTAASRDAVTVMPTSDTLLAGADLAPALPAAFRSPSRARG